VLLRAASHQRDIERAYRTCRHACGDYVDAVIRDTVLHVHRITRMNEMHILRGFHYIAVRAEAAAH
jgi:hypothetical protein